MSYAYDPNDNVSTVTDSVTSANSQAFGYDVLNRLVTAAGGYSLTAAAQSYAYASGTNQLSTVIDGSTTVHQFAYSATGNVTQDNRAGTVFNLGYNQTDRLASVQQGSTPVASYAYDAFGQRLIKTLPGTSTTTLLYQYDQAGHQIEDSDISSGSPSPEADYIYLSNQPVGLVLGTALYYYHRDRLGTPQLLTDGSGAVQWAGNYDPFGDVSITGAITQNLRLPGQYADVETGWYNNGFRTYAPDLGRYVQVDPIGLRGGLNLYRYANGNPVNWKDLLGLCEQDNTHNYSINLWSPCPASETFNDFLEAGASAPGAPAAQVGITPNIPLWNLWGLLGYNNYITQIVDPSTMTITNITQPGHFFSPGTVTIQVTPDLTATGGSNINISGTGSGNYWWLNDIIGYGFFGPTAYAAVLSCADMVVLGIP